MRHQSLNAQPIADRRLLGVYYTPDDLAEVLTAWALEPVEREIPGGVLDPSFGGCAFMSAAARVLLDKGITSPGQKVFGVDIDPGCIEYARRDENLDPGNCTFSNFLEVAPEDIKTARFDAIVGNPPYVRHHWFKGSARKAARAFVDESAIRLPATASTWAYFVLHALRFLRQGGRLAMLVPEAILQADYAQSIREALAEHFGQMTFIHIRDRFFEHTREPVVVIAGSDFGKKSTPRVLAAEGIDELVEILAGAPVEQSSRRVTLDTGRSIASGALDILEHCQDSPWVYPLGKFMTPHIGIVTGANDHFIRSRQEIEQLRLPTNASIPIVCRANWLTGLEYTAADHRQLTMEGKRTCLIRPSSDFDSHRAVRQWIRSGKSRALEERHKCKERTPWFRVVLPDPPNVLATSTRLGSPLIVLNHEGYQCTNTLYSGYWNDGVSVNPEALAIGFLTSLASVWAELEGRRYGGGVLKLDVGTLSRAPVPLVPKAAEIFPQIDTLFRHGKEECARKLADDVVLIQGLGMSAEDVELLRSAQQDLQNQRIPVRRRLND